ncbi:MAG: hypothetical protein WBG50_02710 [Desulfomonilaceae bacterium]
MASVFKEFSDTYKEFQVRFPHHPLNEELRSRISRGKFPEEEWLKIHTKKMKELMAPVWLRHI